MLLELRVCGQQHLKARESGVSWYFAGSCQLGSNATAYLRLPEMAGARLLVLTGL